MHLKHVLAGVFAVASLSLARPWYNTSSVAAYGTGIVGTAPVSVGFTSAAYAHHSSTKGVQSSSLATGYAPAIIANEAHAASVFSSLSSSADGCSVSYITVTMPPVTESPVSVTTDSPLLPSEPSSVEKYSYAIESGITSWIDDVTPPASGYTSTISESSTVVIIPSPATPESPVSTESESAISSVLEASPSSASALVSIVTATTLSTTTVNVFTGNASSVQIETITEIASTTRTHKITITRTKTGVSSDTETANSTSWQWASLTAPTPTDFPSLSPTGSEGLSFTGVLSPQTSATISHPDSSTEGSPIIPASSSEGSPVIPSSSGTAPPAPSSTACGEVGNYTINWDDEPLFVSPKNSTLFPPVFSPYHHLFYANGYAYLAPPADSLKEPFPATSNPNIAIFLPDLVIDATAKNHSVINFTGLLPGEITAGPRASDKTWEFEAYGADLGCDNVGSESCTMTITGYAYDATTKSEFPVAQQKIELPPCDTATLHTCALKHVDFAGNFRGLSGIQFEALVRGQQKIFVLDNLNLGWCDNSCAAGLKRFKTGKN